jgi:[ribosomal protein S5]-alanine N-acetyltransferase
MLTPIFTPFPVLTTERLVLRQLLMDDAPAVQHLRGNKEVMEYISRPLTLSLHDAESWINIVIDALSANNGITWCICLKETPLEHIGTIGIWRIDKENHRGEVGYMIEPAQQGKGLMYEALNAVIQYGFASLRLHTIEARIDPRNTASAVLLHKAGFVQEAYFKESYLLRGCFVDTAVYSLLTPHNPETMATDNKGV